MSEVFSHTHCLLAWGKVGGVNVQFPAVWDIPAVGTVGSQEVFALGRRRRTTVVVVVTGERGGRTPRLVQHIYSAVKMAASEGARSGRTTTKRSWKDPHSSDSCLSDTVDFHSDIVWSTGPTRHTPGAKIFIVKGRVGGFHWLLLTIANG